jgi:hypothetical protein
MDGDATQTALARIDAALARIEAGSARPRQGDPDLQRRHLRLRAEVELAMRDLDQMIAGERR